MAEPAARRHLADRAAEIWKTKDVTYSQAVDEALAEQNPTEDVAVGERLLYALLNVEPAILHTKRRSPRGLPRRDDMGSDTKADPARIPEGEPAADGPETHPQG